MPALELSAKSESGLHVGANYHPHDSTPEQWRKDLAMMSRAGFRVLRAGHLAWDSYEPRDGVFSFDWFDEFMDLATDYGIYVILDVAVRPAPLWLHRKHPTIDIVNAHGKREHAGTRYLEDVGDADYLRHALRFAGELSARYARHPALLAFGIDNEPGSGPYSYSPAVRTRFIAWLRETYGTLDALNAAWAGQRWSRRVSDFEEIDLPRSGAHDGPLERMIDYRTFVSDEIRAAHVAVLERVRENAPGALITGNQWYFVEGDDGRFFDYAPIAYSGAVTRGGGGLYPHNSQADKKTLHHALSVIARVQFESTTPYWATETTTETAVDGAARKAAYASLLYGNQLMCAWTWQSHHGGEERLLQGLVDWDGEPNRKFDEYATIAQEFRRIEAFGFPYRPAADIAIAFSFAAQLASDAFPEQHTTQVDTVFSTVLERNIDVRIIDILHSTLEYRVLILPGLAIINEKMAARIRQFVNDGGTVIMTGNSGWFDEHGQVLRGTRPGLLADVFGIRLGSFRETSVLNEVAPDRGGDRLRVDFADRLVEVHASRFDDVQLRGAEAAATITGLDAEYPAVTTHDYGRGRGIYLSVPARGELLDAVLDRELDRQNIRPSLEVPRGVIARRTTPKHALYVNLTLEEQEIVFPDAARSVLYDRPLSATTTLPPMGVEFIEFDSSSDPGGTGTQVGF